MEISRLTVIFGCDTYGVVYCFWMSSKKYRQSNDIEGFYKDWLQVCLVIGVDSESLFLSYVLYLVYFRNPDVVAL